MEESRPQPEFYVELEKREYKDWTLRDISIRYIGEDQSGVDLVIKVLVGCVPAIRTFNGAPVS